jgi:general secretion pathway protein A
VLITNTHFSSRTDLFQSILFDLNLTTLGKTEQELRLALTDFFLDQFQDGHPTTIIVDEAHLLEATYLEELRLLGNLESRHGKAVQIVLLGQPGILDSLHTINLQGVAQRLSTRVHLEPLTPTEALEFICHQLDVVGGNSQAIFFDDALALIAQHTQGIPRLINQAARQSLNLAFRHQKTSVDIDIAFEALHSTGIACVMPTDRPEEGFVPKSSPPQITNSQLPGIPGTLVYSYIEAEKKDSSMDDLGWPGCDVVPFGIRRTA